MKKKENELLYGSFFVLKHVQIKNKISNHVLLKYFKHPYNQSVKYVKLGGWISH
jgi:hypothetical protein